MKVRGLRRDLSIALKAILIVSVAYAVIHAFLTDDVFPLRYFTIWSNLTAAGVCVLLIAHHDDERAPHSGIHSYLRGLGLLALSVTGIVYHALLVPPEGMSFESHLLHTVVPLGFLVDWLLFDPHETFRLRHVVAWTGTLLVYVPVTLALGLVDGFYPYAFLDVGGLGYGRVILNVLALVVVFSALGGVYVLADRLLGSGLASRFLGAPARQAD